MKKNCDVCKTKLSGPILSLGNQPLCDDLKKIGSYTKNKKYKIQLKLCKECLTINQLHNVNQKTLFPKKYNYRAALTKDVQMGMEKLVSKIDPLIKKKGKQYWILVAMTDHYLIFLRKKNLLLMVLSQPMLIKTVPKIIIFTTNILVRNL